MAQQAATYWWRKKKRTCHNPTPKPGEPCPNCTEGILAYDGLFVLTCARCGKAAENGAFT
ncbi:MAG: hypothetical protein CSB13_08955 [Chloroflexi bacterium]|nr:MAG: hypothetical protein CSB13_08955 [Chloroflexota bacterium]